RGRLRHRQRSRYYRAFAGPISRRDRRQRREALLSNPTLSKNLWRPNKHMIRNSNDALVLVTAPSLVIARALARAALSARLVACANLLPKIESHYWWQGKLEASAEVLILFKTTQVKLKALEKLIVAKHPYDTPEFLVLPISAGNARYLDWLSASVRRL